MNARSPMDAEGRADEDPLAVSPESATEILEGSEA